MSADYLRAVACDLKAAEQHLWDFRDRGDVRELLCAKARAAGARYWLGRAVEAQAGARHRATPKRVRACRKCGCTETTACIDRHTGMACHWVARDLCSACQPPKKGRA